MKKSLIEHRLNISNINPGYLDAGSLIQNELNIFLSERRSKRNKILKIFLLSLAGTALLSILVALAPRIGRLCVDQWYFLRTAGAGKIINENLLTIKKSVIDQIPANCYSDYRATDKSDSAEIKLAYLIHQFGTDFYSKPYDIHSYDERRIYAFAGLDDFKTDNFYHLDRPLIDDSSQTLKNWLLSKIIHRESNYYNPRYAELIQTVQVYQNQYQKELENSLDKTIIRSIRRQLAEQHIIRRDSEQIIQNASQYLIDNPAILAKEYYYRRKIMDLDLELNIRLALFHMVLARDYDIKGNMAILGWMCGDLKGSRIIKERSVTDKYEPFYNEMKSDLNDFYKYNEIAQKLFSSLDFNELQLIINNPLKVGLIVKDIGLFAMARKNEKGLRYEHKGVDLIAEEGTPVYPVQDGFVCLVGNDGSGHGNHIEIWHDSNVRSVYSHLNNDKAWQNILRKFKQEGPFLTTTKEQIASVGTSGNIPEGDAQYGYSHLHLEIRENGKPLNPFLLFTEKINVIH